MAIGLEIQTWGPFILLPYPKSFGDSPVPAGVSADASLTGIDFAVDARVVRATSLEEVPLAVRGQLRLPSVPLDNDLELRGVWYAVSENGQLFRSDVFWHRRTNRSPFGTDPRGTADVRVVRTRAQQPPVLVAHGSPRDPGAAIAAWTVVPTFVAGTQGLYHRFQAHQDIDLVAQRAWVEADALEWFDHEAYKNVAYGWRLTEAELKDLASSMRAAV
jgi:hypothetical protein